MKTKIFINIVTVLLLGFISLPINVYADSSQTNTPTIQTSSQNELFVNNVIQALFNYDYQNYQDKLRLASKYFTQPGWTKYQKALVASGNLESLMNRKQTISGKIIPPIQFSQTNETLIATVLVEVNYKQTGGEFSAQQTVILSIVNTPDGSKVDNFIATIHTP